MVPKLKDLDYEARLESLNLFSLQSRRERGDMILLYKLFNGHTNASCNDLFTMASNSITRGHKYKITKQRSLSDNRSNYFTNRVVDPWNKLPDFVINSDNTTQFKWNYDKFIKQSAKYT